MRLDKNFVAVYAQHDFPLSSLSLCRLETLILHTSARGGCSNVEPPNMNAPPVSKNMTNLVDGINANKSPQNPSSCPRMLLPLSATSGGLIIKRERETGGTGKRSMGGGYRSHPPPSGEASWAWLGLACLMMSKTHFHLFFFPEFYEFQIRCGKKTHNGERGILAWEMGKKEGGGGH